MLCWSFLPVYLWQEGCGAAVKFPHSAGYTGHHLHTALVILTLTGVVGREVRPELRTDGPSGG